MAIDPAARISRLRALIDHPRTGSSERDAAQRMLNRVLHTLRPISDSRRQYGSAHGRLGRHTGLETIAEMIRADIALARAELPSPAEGCAVAAVDPVADAPNEIQFDVDVRHECEIVVTIADVPTVWGWHRDSEIDVHSPALRALVDEIASIINSYNHSGTDITSRFFGRVRVEDTTVVW